MTIYSTAKAILANTIRRNPESGSATARRSYLQLEIGTKTEFEELWRKAFFADELAENPGSRNCVSCLGPGTSPDDGCLIGNWI